MHRLICNVQKYGWGRRGHESKCALFKKCQDNSFVINESETYAELWMGTHPNCPSYIQLDQSKNLLSDYIKSEPCETLGTSIKDHFYNDQETLQPGDLPFLFKVLSINQALSIQAHPNKILAKQLNKSDPKNYPDSNHKPEMLISISERFHALCGFRPAHEIIRNFSIYPELVDLCSKQNCDLFIQSKSEHDLKLCFSTMMNQSENYITDRFNQLKQRLSNSSDLSDLDKLYLNLSEQYKNDVGCFSIYLLNFIELKKGEAIFLCANIPHAYLYGDGVECMACSDNVVRAGLTPKFKDVKILCEMLDYTMRSSEENKLKPAEKSSYLTEFRPSVDEFSVQEIKISRNELNNENFLIPAKKSCSILIITEASSSEFYFQVGSTKLEARPGLVYYINPNLDVSLKIETQFVDDQSDLIFLAYRAYCDIKN